MVEEPLTRDRILDTAEDVLRRFGPAKTSVVDVARALGVSHAAIYRYYDSKAALRDAVTERWLDRLTEPLSAVVAEDLPPVVRLRRWLERLGAAKRRSSREEPELFAMYVTLASESGEAVQKHTDILIRQLARILQDGIDLGDFSRVDPEATALGIYWAMTRFYHPAHAANWEPPELERSFEAVWNLILNGIVPDPASTGKGRGAKRAR